MSNINGMIQAARDSKPANFNKLFEAEVTERILEAVAEMRTDVVAEMFGISEEEDCEDDKEGKKNVDDEGDDREGLSENVIKRGVALAGRTARGTVKDSLRTASRKIGVGAGMVAGMAAAHATGQNLTAGAAAGGTIGAMGVQAAREALARRRANKAKG